jgi:hypothetical protein
MKHGEIYLINHIYKGIFSIKIHSTDSENITGTVVGLKEGRCRDVRIDEKLAIRRQFITNCYQV